MAEVFIVTFSYFHDLLLDVIDGNLIGRALLFVGIFPVLELVIATAVENVVAFAALKQGLFGTDLTFLGLEAVVVVLGTHWLI